ncbi:YihY/virulence factor BrkB family protein [Cellulomonas sp. WB94]|uniref:YihY/virulence factor BrkB family protein n=1 Tax=Cellulomonas sp. WB94 TaxID=2173174 RepID=UPI000D5732A5|nr:YihY/virulence factor BrkB family protein [Cellulomonas sp. WB94]PVU83599.1 YihY/virulence factor BrkB family protein [Cellulomonas sp. WB94]
METPRADAGAGAPLGVKGGSVARARAVLAWWQLTRAGRANARFGAAGGGVLTGGIAYAALFSVFAALTIAYTAFVAVIGRDAQLRQDVLRTVSASLPGLVDSGSGDGLVKPDELVLGAGLNVAGLVAVVVLLLSATSALAALRTAVRAMFDERSAGGNVLTGKLREVAGLVGVALAFLVSAVLGLAVTSAAGWLLRLVGLGAGVGVATTVLGFGVALVVDAATFVLVVRVLAGIHPPWPDLRQGALICAVGVGVVRLLGTSVVAGGARQNAVLASFAAVVTLLVWINLIARIVLLAAAWTADPPAAVAGAAPERPAGGSTDVGPAVVSEAALRPRPADVADARHRPRRPRWWRRAPRSERG